MIHKTISTFDNQRPIEDTPHLLRLMSYLELFDAAAHLLDDDPRTAEQRDADEQAADWRDTYNSLLP